MKDKPEEADAVLYLFRFYQAGNPNKDIGQFLLVRNNNRKHLVG